jgi:hypothetical protein
MYIIRAIVISNLIANKKYCALSYMVRPVVCVIMMKLKVRLETDEWIYEEHEII